MKEGGIKLKDEKESIFTEVDNKNYRLKLQEDRKKRS